MLLFRVSGIETPYLLAQLLNNRLFRFRAPSGSVDVCCNLLIDFDLFTLYDASVIEGECDVKEKES